MRRLLIILGIAFTALVSCNSKNTSNNQFGEKKLSHNDSIIENQVEMYRNNLTQIVELKNQLDTIELTGCASVEETNNLLEMVYEFHRQYALLLSDVYVTRLIYSNEVADTLLKHNIHIYNPDMYANFIVEIDSLFYKEASLEGNALSKIYYKYLSGIKDTCNEN